jgi:hypothetical protein
MVSFADDSIFGFAVRRGSSDGELGAVFTMAATGELIRLINYVDDINTTLRRISASVPAMDGDERKRLADSLRVAASNLNGVIANLDKGAQ